MALPKVIKIAAHQLRTNMTESETFLWKKLRRNKLFGKRILRQRPILVMEEDDGFKRYIIADFVCLEDKVIIEIDGSIHNSPEVESLDREKEILLKNRGFRILRFTNEEVFGTPDIVLEEIATSLLGSQRREFKRGLCSSEQKPEFKGELGQTKRFKMINDSFACENCKREIPKHPSGSARNHCPYCLYSKHLDKDFPGDRASTCHGLMKPVGKDYHKNKGWMVIHECIKCGKKIPNKLAEDDDVGVFGKI